MKALNNVGILGLTLLGNAAHAQAPETVPSLGSVTVIAAPTPYRQFDKVEITGSAILAKEAREALPIRQDIAHTLKRIAPYADTLQSQPALQHIDAMLGVQGNHASELRRCFAKSGSVEGVVRCAVDLLRQA